MKWSRFAIALAITFTIAGLHADAHGHRRKRQCCDPCMEVRIPGAVQSLYVCEGGVWKWVASSREKSQLDAIAKQTVNQEFHIAIPGKVVQCGTQCSRAHRPTAAEGEYVVAPFGSLDDESCVRILKPGSAH
jgi:hypothetical protein